MFDNLHLISFYGLNSNFNQPREKFRTKYAVNYTDVKLKAIGCVIGWGNGGGWGRGGGGAFGKSNKRGFACADGRRALASASTP
jgi:hypothetical protein